jgi:hypothetical protein
MKARRILWLYCVFACLALAAGLIVVVATSGPLRAASDEAAQALGLQEEAVAKQNEIVVSLEEEQRAKRAGLTAEDAIRYSAEVQAEKQTLEEYTAHRDAAQATFVAASQAYKKHMGRLIPIIALLILHVVGTMLFWPRKA